MKRFPRAIFELIESGVADDKVRQVIEAIATPNGNLESLLRVLPIADHLRADLWDAAYPASEMSPITDEAAMEICRQVVLVYQVLSEYDRKGRDIRGFLLDVNRHVMLVTTEPLLIGNATRGAKIACGRQFAACGLWPVPRFQD